jgi:shikimate kinase
MRKVPFDLCLRRRHLRQRPCDAIDRSPQEDDDNQEAEAIRHQKLPIPTILSQVFGKHQVTSGFLCNSGGNLRRGGVLETTVMTRRTASQDVRNIRNRLGNRPLVLIGLMGAGKSSIGRRLAEKLEIPFVDADHEIEVAAGKSIAEIFADHGEPYFREGERRVIARLIDNGAQVLATGGGAYMNEETRAIIGARGVSVWLKAGLPLLMRRVTKRGDRPLLQNGDPEAVMKTLMASRYPIYARADVTVESKDVQHGQMVNEVIRSLARWQGWDRPEDA